MAVFDGKKLSNDIINNDTMSDDGVVASYIPPRYLFPPVWSPIGNNALVFSDAFSHL